MSYSVSQRPWACHIFGCFLSMFTLSDRAKFTIIFDVTFISKVGRIVKLSWYVPMVTIRHVEKMNIMAQCLPF